MRLLFILAAVVLVVVAAANSRLMARYAEAGDVDDAIPAVSVPIVLEQSEQADPDVKLVLLALRPEGFETSEMQLDPGDYIFIIGNRTGLKAVNIRLDREGMGRIALAALGGRGRDWKQRMKLTTGTYLVTANDNPDWICRIVVGR
jgi:hypothetical protein